ncbi:MAG: DUF1573 domain-containing protein [Flavobacteriales bacterium]|nr:DUF1573 domain-containing protein [Flavobacteriales bacterium]
MKNKIQIALLAVIAVALAALAASQFMNKDASPKQSNVVAETPATANVAQNTPSPTTSFDPLASRTSTVENRAKTSVSFGKYEHDFGNVVQDSHNHFTFTFTNTGREPLVIESATGSCGCTVPNYPKQPIPPGGTGQIEIEYKPGKQENAQTKTVTVVANTEPKETVLRVKAFVKPA